jgi:glutamine synthetase
MTAVTKDGKLVNLFAAAQPKEDFMSVVGYGSIMGLLKNYEVINPFVSATNDSLNRLKPGFEAPVCIVTSLGHNPAVPSRNRTILAGLIRDLDNPMATRFELRACNPYTNTYLVLAAIYSAMLDGITATVAKSTKECVTELSKTASISKKTARTVPRTMCSRITRTKSATTSLARRRQRFGKICRALKIILKSSKSSRRAAPCARRSSMRSAMAHCSVGRRNS